MVWMAIVLDSGAQTITRPMALDVIEAWLNDDDPPTRRLHRALALDACMSGQWDGLATAVGVAPTEIDCFLNDWLGDDRTTFLEGIADALRVSRATEDRYRLRFLPALADRTHVDYEVDADGITVILAAPAGPRLDA